MPQAARGFALALISAMARWLPRAPVLKLPNKDFSRDPRIVANINADSLIAGEKQPAATVAALITADRRLDRDFGKEQVMADVIDWLQSRLAARALRHTPPRHWERPPRL